MNLFSVFKKQLGYGQASDVPTVVPNASHPVDSEVLCQGVDPITAE